MGCAAAGMLASAAFAQSQFLVKKDFQFFTKNSFSSYASPWSTFTIKTLRSGIDYWDTVTIDPTQFPNNTTIRTKWPTTVPSTGVWGYHHIAFGNYDGGLVQQPIAPLQVNAIKQLQESWSFAYSSSPNFNLLNEFYLTSRPGDATAKVIEIGIFQHVPAATQRYVDSLTPIGTYQEAQGRTWRITRVNNFVMLTPTTPGDILTGTFDFRALLLSLKGRKIITGNEWFNGLGFGSEPTAGADYTAIYIRNLSVTYR